MPALLMFLRYLFLRYRYADTLALIGPSYLSGSMTVICSVTARNEWGHVSCDWLVKLLLLYLLELMVLSWWPEFLRVGELFSAFGFGSGY